MSEIVQIGLKLSEIIQMGLEFYKLVQIGQDLSEIIKINLDLNLSVIDLNLFFYANIKILMIFLLFLGTGVDQQNVEFGWRFNTITRTQPLQPLWNYCIPNVTPQCWRPCCTS